MTTLQKLNAEVIETVNGMGAVVFAALISRLEDIAFQERYRQLHEDDVEENHWSLPKGMLVYEKPEPFQCNNIEEADKFIQFFGGSLVKVKPVNDWENRRDNHDIYGISNGSRDGCERYAG